MLISTRGLFSRLLWLGSLRILRLFLVRLQILTGALVRSFGVTALGGVFVLRLLALGGFVDLCLGGHFK